MHKKKTRVNNQRPYRKQSSFQNHSSNHSDAKAKELAAARKLGQETAEFLKLSSEAQASVVSRKFRIQHLRG